MKRVCGFKMVACTLILCSSLVIGSVAAWGSESEYYVGPTAINEELYSKLEGSADSITAFIGEPFYEGIFDEDGAIEALESVLDELGADETTELVLDSIRPTENGLTYYTFRQSVGDITVYGSAVKLIVDDEGNAVCVISSLVPDMPEATAPEWTISEKEAEEIISTIVEGSGAKIYSNQTQQTLMPGDNILGIPYYAWVVYTNNPWGEVDTAYMAHFVNEGGDYLGSVPVQEPMGAETINAAGTEFLFMGMEADRWTQEVTLYDGRVKELTVPVMVDPETGTVYLADMERRIACADSSDFDFNDSITLRQAEDGRFADNELVTYASIIDVWDLYDSIGWTGPDGEGTATLLLMDWVDEYGEPVINACYSGMINGFQAFRFNREEQDGECLDTIGHEYTHCVTSTLMTANLYKNDPGAINEAISDIMGNIIEHYLTDNEDPEWLVGEGANREDMILRCMSDPHRYNQPEYVWDMYYYPNTVLQNGDLTDNGGVHINSSLLNLIAYRLYEAGMPLEDEFDFWLNVVMAITPWTDYPQMAELLPWVMIYLEYDEYLDVLLDAIFETGISDVLPEYLADGYCLIFFSIPEEEILSNEEITLLLIGEGEDGSEYESEYESNSYLLWVDPRFDLVIGTVPEGEYLAYLNVMYEDDVTPVYMITGDGWLLLDEEGNPEGDLSETTNYTLVLEEGDFYDLDDEDFYDLYEEYAYDLEEEYAYEFDEEYAYDLEEE